MTDMHIGWIVALTAGAMTGLVFTGLVTLMKSHRHRPTSAGFNLVLGMVGAIMINAAANLAGQGGSQFNAAASAVIGAIALLLLNRILSRRIWARWYP